MATSRVSIVQKLEQSLNITIDPSKMDALIDGLGKSVGQQTKLTIPWIRTDILGCVALALEVCTTIKLLDFSGITPVINFHDTEQRKDQVERIKLIANILQKNQSIQYLILDKCCLITESANIFINALKNSSILELRMNDCEFEKQEDKERIQKVAQFKHIKTEINLYKLFNLTDNFKLPQEEDLAKIKIIEYEVRNFGSEDKLTLLKLDTDCEEEIKLEKKSIGLSKPITGQLSSHSQFAKPSKIPRWSAEKAKAEKNLKIPRL